MRIVSKVLLIQLSHQHFFGYHILDQLHTSQNMINIHKKTYEYHILSHEIMENQKISCVPWCFHGDRRLRKHCNIHPIHPLTHRNPLTTIPAKNLTLGTGPWRIPQQQDGNGWNLKNDVPSHTKIASTLW